MSKNLKDIKDITRLPLLPLRGLMAFPNTVVTFDVGRPRSVSALERALEGDKRVLIVAQRDAENEKPELKDIYTVGTIVTIKHIIRLPDEVVRVLAEGECRAMVLDVIERGELQQAELVCVNERGVSETPEIKAYMRLIKRIAVRLSRAHMLNSPELLQTINGERDASILCDIVSANLLTSLEDKQAVLECMDIKLRLETLLKLLKDELQIAALEARIDVRVRESMDKANRDYYLREQIGAIRKELSEDDEDELAELKNKLAKSAISGEARERTERELKRLERVSSHAPEAAISENYIEYMLNLPWGVKTGGDVSLSKARRILEADHYGMKEVKERLLEYLAVYGVNKQLKSPVICLVGAPGVGKTSIARSVARAMGRKFAQMSLGGVHDEAEIRGHRKTYLGAMPGRIVSSIRQCGSLDPVFLLDEVDKLARDMRGDPASALLEVLDKEQNSGFRDHYIEAPFDLSNVLFITTANATDTIDRALLDRMEIIEVPSYTVEEKAKIAKLHLLPKQRKAHGLRAAQLRISDKALNSMICEYTREAGVRSLEKLIAKTCRKAALEMLEDGGTHVSVKPENLAKYLGAPRYISAANELKPCVGRVNGLAWTSVGGEVMPIEALLLNGKGETQLTGNLGDVMKESARIALSFVRSRMEKTKPSAEHDKRDIHLNVPEGATPKDGPSAGVAIACAMLSAMLGIPARQDVAMTGELTLLGGVLPIGGVKEKLLAAYRMGIINILLPRMNEKDLEDIEPSIREKFNITLIDDADQAISIVLPALSFADIKVAV